MDDTTRGVGQGDEHGRGAQADEATDGRTRELRAQIDRTREDMSETIDAIQDKLRPGNIVAEARERVRHATSERMQQMAGEGNRQNLVPAALIGIGTAWLMMNRGGSSRGGWNRKRWGAAAAPGFGERTGAGAIGTGGTAGAVDLGADIESEGTGVSALAGRATERAGEWADETRDAVQRTSRRARNQFSRMLDTNPLAVGAAAIALGAIVGMAFPETERENRWMGETRETVVDRAKESARGLAP